MFFDSHTCLCVYMQTPHLLCHSHCSREPSCQHCGMLMAPRMMSLRVSWLPESLGLQFRTEMCAEQQAAHRQMLSSTSIHEATLQFFHPQFVPPGPPPASRFKPINISYLINKWNGLFSYFWVVPLPAYAGDNYNRFDIVSVILIKWDLAL